LSVNQSGTEFEEMAGFMVFKKKLMDLLVPLFRLQFYKNLTKKRLKGGKKF
jgi:hypothetical protein